MTTGAEALAGGEQQQVENGGEQQQQNVEQKTGEQQQQTAAPAAWDIPADRKDYVDNKGWKGPNDMLESYTSLEKTLGLSPDARADALLVRPKADAKPEEQAAFVEKAISAYVPDKAEGYGNLGIDLKEGESLPVEIEQARGWMKEAGIPAPLAPKLVAAYQADLAKAETAFQNQSTQDMKDLASEFGDKSEDNFELGRRAFRAAKEQGLTPEKLAAMERAVGTKDLMKLFIGFGKNQTELPGGGAPGNSGNASNGFTLSVEGAKAKVQSLLQDSAFQARYNSPNIQTRQAAIAEMEVYQKAATGTA